MSYPRTASQYLGDDNVELFKEKFETLSKAYPSFVTGCVKENMEETNKRIYNSKKVEGHHALIPLAPLPESATEEQKNVYNTVLERFFTVTKKPFTYVQIVAEAKSGELEFTAKGRRIIQHGWKKNEKETEDTEEQENAKLPQLQENDTVEIVDTGIEEKWTKPKPHFTNATLLSLMENPKNENDDTGKLAGLGTPATRASIISELVQRQYIEKSKKNLVITELGKFLIDTVITIPSLAKFTSVSTTTNWEQLLQDNPEDFLDKIKSFTNNELLKIKITTKWKQPEKESLGTCPCCHKGNIVEGKSSYYCTEYKNNCQFKLWKEVCSAKLTPQDVNLLLQGKQTRPKKMKSKANKEFTAKLELKENKISFVFEKNLKVKR